MFLKLTKFFKRYRGFTLNAMKENYAYKFKNLIWTLYDLISLFIQYFLWVAIFEANDGVFYGLSLSQYINYIVVGIMTFRILMCFIDSVIADDVKNGNIAMNFVKPCSFITINIFRHIGYTISGMISLVPLLIAAFFLVGFVPVSFTTAAFYAISLGFSFFIILFFNIFLGILTFWITNYWGLRLLKWHLFAIFSGELIAINVFFLIADNGIQNFPVAIQESAVQGFFRALGIIAYCLPFQAMTYTPSAIYSGLISGTDKIIAHIGLQAFWVFFMLGLMLAVWKKATKHVTILGG